MDKDLALERINLLMKKQHAEYRHRMNYLGIVLGWNRPKRVLTGRGGRKIFF